MQDPTDYLFLFWGALCGGIYLFGTIYEHQIRRTFYGNEKSVTQRDFLAVGDTHKKQHQPAPLSREEAHQNYEYSTNLDGTYLCAPGSHQEPSNRNEWPADLTGRHSGAHLGRQTLDAGDEIPIPTASGFNADCVDWINSILFLFYSQPGKYGPMLSESLHRSLNEKVSAILSSASPEFANISMEFLGLTMNCCSKPELTNIKTENETDKSISVVCKVYNRCMVFELLVANSSRTVQQHFELTLESLEGKLRALCMPCEQLIVVQFIEKPDTKIRLRLLDLGKLPASSAGHQEEAYLVSEDTLVSIILQSMTQTVVDLYFGDDLDFPRYRQTGAAQSGYRQRLNQLKGSASEIKRQIKQDFFGALTSGANAANSDKERKIFIKLIRATNINYNSSVTCLLELDAPHRLALSSTKPSSSNPSWDEHFLFAAGDKPAELIFELWDSVSAQALEPRQESPPASNSKRRFFGGSGQSSASGLAQQQQQQQSHQEATVQVAPGRWLSKSELTQGAKFLGQARFSVQELRSKPVQRCHLSLEPGRQPDSASEPSGAEPVGGELELELLFLEHALPGAGSGGGQQRLSPVGIQQGDLVSVERKVTPAGYVITTTTITKPAQQQQQQTGAGRRLAADRSAHLAARDPTPVSTLGSTGNQSVDLTSQLDGLSLSEVSQGAQPSLGPSESSKQRAAGAARPESRRARSRSRSFLRAIRKRFSFSRTRSRSVGEPRPESSRADARSALDTSESLDSRSRASSVASNSASSANWRAKSVPASPGARLNESLPTIVINRGRLDSAGAFSFAPAKSQLVIECSEPLGAQAAPTDAAAAAGSSAKQQTAFRYYAVPEDDAAKAKWRRRGTKLHLFNEHQFVACHLAGSSTCHLCGRLFSRRPGKQGYKCRNCHLLSHKQCHVKVDHNCPYAVAGALKLEYIDSEPAACLVEAARKSATLDSRSRAGKQLLKGRSPMISKSISVDADER